jgi:[ribosomal protein S5]-alanine N-acetyltransferase
VSAIESERLGLVLLTGEFMAALLEGRRHQAASLVGITMPDEWPNEHDLRFLRFRQKQLAKDPEHGPWLVRAVTLLETGRPMIGHAGFHGKPGVNALKADDAVELGYTVFEDYRGHGYATEAVRALMDWAADEHGIRRFVASVSPENAPSLAVVRKLGFAQVGQHWDEEDGLELEFELRV